MSFAVYYFTTASGRSPVKDFLVDQDRQARDKIVEVIEYLREYGFQLSTQYLRRMSGSKALWELRAKYRSKQYRIFLAKTAETDILLVHAIIKKTPKTPKTDIQTAEERLNAFKKGGL
jgi:phage-related protein